MKRWVVRGLQGYLIYVLIMVVVSFLAAYKGRVLDAETKEPIEGVVVFMEWDYLQFDIMPHSFMLSGVVETLTDKNGRFSLPWWWSFNPWRTLAKRNNVTIFKSGYKPITGGTWAFLVEEDWGSPKGTYILKVEGGKPVILLKRFSDIDKRHENMGSLNHKPTKNNLLLREINKERLFLGLDLIPIR